MSDISRRSVLRYAGVSGLGVAGVVALPATAASAGPSTPALQNSAPGSAAGQTGRGRDWDNQDFHGLRLGSDPAAKQAAALVESSFAGDKLLAAIVGVWRRGEPVVVGTLGESMTGVPATTAMHHITGNVTTAMVTTVLLELVDRGRLALEDKLSKWFPKMPAANMITLDMLAHQTSGYVHYVNVPAFRDAFYANPFRAFTAAEDVQYAFDVPEPVQFRPGTNWTFADTNVLVLQLVMEKETGKPMGQLIREGVLNRLGLRQTTLATTAAKPEPVLHAYSGERGVWEDTTYWNPGWTQYAGGLSSNQHDLRRFIEAAGSGELLSARSHRAQLAPDNVGFGRFTKHFYYAMGIGVTNGWVFVNPGLQGYTAGIATLPSKKITIVVYCTRTQAANQDALQGSSLFVKLATLLSPDQAPAIPGS